MINGRTQKFSIIAIVLGIVIASVIFSIGLIYFQIPNMNNPPNNPPNNNSKIGIGAKIASQIAASEADIENLWCYNNTWVNFNLSNMYNDIALVDGINIGTRNGTLTMALIHEPEAEFREVNQTDVDSVIALFRSSLSALNTTTNTVENLASIFPPTFMLDIAYKNGSSLSLVYSYPEKVLGIVNGTWEYSSYYFHGFQILQFQYETDETLFLPFDDVFSFNDAIKAFETLVLSLYPN